jgi:hypothetical protein
VVRLENLGVALLGEGSSHPERHLWLTACLELKREVTVELLAACCERASEEELERVQSACFLLGDAVCWELKRPQWQAMEFELLRQAALVAQRPGHWLLIQTLEQACRGMAGRVEPFLDSAALYRWTQCALEALCSKDVKALRSRLPTLLQASDERVLQALAPTCEAHGVASLLGAQRQAPEVEAKPHLTPAQVPVVSEPAEVLLTTSKGAAESEPAEALHTTSQGAAESKPAEAPLTSAQAPEVGQPAPEHIQAAGPGALCANWSGHRTTLREVPPEGAPPGPAPLAPRSTSSPGDPGSRSTKEDAWPWPACGRVPGLI